MQDDKVEQKSAFSCNLSLDWTSFAGKEPEQGTWPVMP